MYNKCTISVQWMYNRCTKSVHLVYRKCTACFFSCTKSVHLVYRKCTASFFSCTEDVQFMYNSTFSCILGCTRMYRGSCTNLYIVGRFSTIVCTLYCFSSPGWYIVLFQAVHSRLYILLEKIVYKWCTMRVQKVYSQKKKCTVCVHFVYQKCTTRKKKCTVCVHSVYQKCTDSIFECTFGCTESVHKCTEKGDLFALKNAATRAEVFRYCRYLQYLSLWSSMG